VSSYNLGMEGVVVVTPNIVGKKVICPNCGGAMMLFSGIFNDGGLEWIFYSCPDCYAASAALPIPTEGIPALRQPLPREVRHENCC
jgi:hypothetical protein